MALIAFLVSIALIAYVVASSPLRGLGRLLSPDCMMAVMLAMIFGIRPLFTQRLEDRSFYGLSPTPGGLDTALVVGIACMLSVALGTFLCSLRPAARARLGARTAAQSSALRLSSGRVVLIAAMSVALYAALMTAFAGPGVLNSLQRGRSRDLSLSAIPEVVLLTPLGGSLAAGLFLISRRGKTVPKADAILLAVATLLSVVMISQLGNRRFLIPAVLIPLISAAIRRPVRIKMWHLVLSASTFLFLAIIPLTRSSGARLGNENLLTASIRYFNRTGITGVVSPVFTSYDTEMFDYIAIVSPRLGASIPFGLGQGTFLEFLTRPFPAQFFPLQAFSERVLTSIQGGGCGQPSCPVASVAGVLYFDGGLVAVALGSLLFGAGVRALANRLAFHEALTESQLGSVVILSSFALVATRTNTVHAIWWAFYSLLLFAVIYRTALRSPRHSESTGNAAAPGTRARPRRALAASAAGATAARARDARSLAPSPPTVRGFG